MDKASIERAIQQKEIADKNLLDSVSKYWDRATSEMLTAVSGAQLAKWEELDARLEDIITKLQKLRDGEGGSDA